MVKKLEQTSLNDVVEKCDTKKIKKRKIIELDNYTKDLYQFVM